MNLNYLKNIIVVCPLSYKKDTLNILKNIKLKLLLEGTRQKSVFNGINYCKKFNAENIIIHDVVRPFFQLINSKLY